MLQERRGGLFRKRARSAEGPAGDAEAPTTATTSGQPPAAPTAPPDGPGIDVVALTGQGGRTWEDLLSVALDEPGRVSAPPATRGRGPTPVETDAPDAPDAPETAGPTGPAGGQAGGTVTEDDDEDRDSPDGDDAVPGDVDRGQDDSGRPRQLPLSTTILPGGRQVVRYRIELGPDQAPAADLTP
jgi:hypothetical protein